MHFLCKWDDGMRYAKKDQKVVLYHHRHRTGQKGVQTHRTHLIYQLNDVLRYDAHRHQSQPTIESRRERVESENIKT